MHKNRLGVDSVVAVELILANGTVVTADAKTNTESVPDW
jgi:hypothetical protein